MKEIIALAIGVLMLFSCSHKKVNKTYGIPAGTYSGQFIRSSPLARYAPSNVTITFVGNSFSGVSDKINYPAICNGTFNISGKTIEFENECIWTADFDWSYILKEKFEFNMVGGKLEMTKVSGVNTDHYTLVLQ